MNKGDIVIFNDYNAVISFRFNLTVGKKYIVQKSSRETIDIIDNNGVEGSFFKNRFTLLKEQREKKLKRILK
jgi:hypothetical protein